MSEDLAPLQKLEKNLMSLDITRLRQYQDQIENLTHGANTMNAPMYLRDFILAYDEANNLLARATRYLGQADSALKMAESMAYFENAPEYLEKHSVKDSSEARKRYVPLDPHVQDAERVKSLAESMVQFLKNKMMEFRLAHDDVKKIAYANDNNNSPYEGM